ncbi:methanol--corrinoid protein MtaC [Methanosalsum natronophilum]|uniref:Methanol--cobalamin methyltransferase n=1 Tax=Methanosalsum natronophilum TaxID=768733 RepID=A0A3R7WE14_9EURY|nr:methanol--corrinoid protein MtaC [Methanosalsum natronophilum]MCS3923420.1 methanol corrinoid protein [Methanosalsum natronophilum]RQD84280.1 MAG: methanol--cobalamin methyltransferase [Methanosalsum natronophilum]
MLDINPDKILIRYNVKVEDNMTADEAAEELYPTDNQIRLITKAIFEGDEDEVISCLKIAMDDGLDPLYLINEALMEGMEIVSRLYDEGIIYLPDVIISAHAMIDGIEYCKEMSNIPLEYNKGKVISFVVEGDIHDIGKTIVTILLRANGYQVIDLGRDVPVDDVVEAVKKERPLFLSGTALMTTTMHSFRQIKEKLEHEGIDVPFVCGGGAVTQDFVSHFDLGIYGEEAADVPKIAESILKGLNITQLREKFHRH